MPERMRWRRGVGLSVSPHHASNRKHRDYECHAGIPDPISIVRTESHLSTSPWSVSLLMHAHGAGTPSIQWKSERGVRKSDISGLPRPVVFAASTLLAIPVVIRTSQPRGGGNRPAPRCCDRFPRPRFAVPSNRPLPVSGPWCDFCGNWGCRTPPKASSLISTRTGPVRVARMPLSISACNKRCRLVAIAFSFARPLLEPLDKIPTIFAVPRVNALFAPGVATRRHGGGSSSLGLRR